MIVFLLLVIVAILLFGSSAVLGAFGSCLGIAAGFTVAMFLVIWIASALGVDAGSVLMWAFGAILVFALVGAALAPDQPASSSKKPSPHKKPSSGAPAVSDHVRAAMEKDRMQAAEFNERVKRQKDEKPR